MSVSLVHKFFLIQLSLKFVHISLYLSHMILITVHKVHLMFANHAIHIILHLINHAIQLKVVPLKLHIGI